MVPTRHKKFFALPQSPQIYKQLLMIGGFKKYFQIAKCFRDEDLRSDRQPEITQLDIEMSFVDHLTIKKLVENMLFDLFWKFFQIKLPLPFIKLKYDEAIAKYGSDKPDLRFANEIIDFNPYLKDQTTCHIGLFIEENFSKEDKALLTKFANDNHIKVVHYISIQNNRVVNWDTKLEHLKPLLTEKFLHAHKFHHGTLIYIFDPHKNEAYNAMGLIRNHLFNILKNLDPKDFKFCWITDWPLFEYSKEEKRFVASHHPFTSPTSEFLDNFEKHPTTARSLQYDLVLNGFEIAGGSIRNSSKAIQNRMFKFLGLTDSEIERKFGFLLNAFNYGVPPHGGIALGLERMIAKMLNTNSIRDVIAFPKNSSGNDNLFGTPSVLHESELKELHLKYIDQKDV